MYIVQTAAESISFLNSKTHRVGLETSSEMWRLKAIQAFQMAIVTIYLNIDSLALEGVRRSTDKAIRYRGGVMRRATGEHVFPMKELPT